MRVGSQPGGRVGADARSVHARTQHLPSRMGLALLLFMQFLLVRVLLLLLLVRRLPVNA